MLVTITEECILCGACEAINSRVFSIDVKPNVNQDKIEGNENDCIDAALICPVNAIWIDDIF